MKLKLLLLSILVAFSFSCSAQSIWGPLGKPATKDKAIVIVDTLPIPGTVFTGFRVDGPAVLYALPESTIYTGIGIDYEHDTYNTGTGRWYQNWAVGGLLLAGGQFAPVGVSGVTGVGIHVKLLNGFLTFGGIYNFTTKKVQGAVGPTANIVPQN